MLKLILIGCVLIGVANLSGVNYYEILGISKQATAQEIRQAYKKLAIKYHPDKNQNTVEQETFIKITEAYETLKDPVKRRNYDIYGSYPSYSHKYDSRSQAEYDNLYYNGLYHNDPFVETLSGANFYNFLKEGFYFINFYSPFCPPCQNVADSWKKLAEIYKGIVKVGAVNCKYHTSFCSHSMRIGSYPTLLFYPNGKNSNFIYYRGERTLEALDEYVIVHLRRHVHIPTVSQLKNIDKPMAYVLGVNRIESNALTRIAYQLNGLVSVVLVEDDDIREKLTKDQDTTVVFKYKSTKKEIQNIDEKEIVKEISDALPKIKQIDPEQLKVIRSELRSGSKIPWVFYFSTKEENKLQLHQLMIAFPNLNFGEIDCDKWAELCASLHVEAPPAWGVLKRGGAYQRAHTTHIEDFLQTAIQSHRLHTLSTSDFTRILDGDTGVWVLLVAPHQVPWESMAEPFTQASLHFATNEDINFGILSCTATSDHYCRQVAHDRPVIRIQNGTKEYTYNGHVNRNSILEFINIIRDSGDMELDEQQLFDIMDPGRKHSWLVAFLPKCGDFCDRIAHEWLLVARKLRALPWVRVGLLRCGTSGLCANVRSPTARLYPIASQHHYSVSLQHLSEAPYMLEWALEYIDDSVQKLNWPTFSRNVIAEELNLSSGQKPWLVYYHSPRCYRCYEMYADFAIAAIFLKNAVNVGKVNCISERGLCQHEQINSYPTLKLYLNRNHRQKISSVITLQIGDHSSLQRDIKTHLAKYDQSLLDRIDHIGISKDYLRDEL